MIINFVYFGNGCFFVLLQKFNPTLAQCFFLVQTLSLNFNKK
jgi:hypothetical protein